MSSNGEPEGEKTRFIHLGREHAKAPLSPVNPPLVRASTVLYGTVANMHDTRRRSNEGENIFRYGSHGTPTTFALEEAITEIEGGARTMLFPTGLAAIAHVFLSVLRPGDSILMADSVYRPARNLATDYLPERGITTDFYSGGQEEVARRLKRNTRMVYLDNPGSIIYDIQDVRALAEMLKGSDTLLVVDNTWGAGGIYKPIELGADISVIAVTKYIAGHSDVMMGSVTANHRTEADLRKDASLLGQTVSPDDAYQALRGIRTLKARLPMHEANAREVISFLQGHPEVERVLYPGLEADAGHELWKRDFNGANGLLSFEFKPDVTHEQHARFVDSLKLFGLGASWGGYESLVMIYPKVPGWSGNRLARLHIGLEDPKDLIADLKQSLDGMRG
ncbi:MAG TPA: cystathionine beta-lyase [Hyphomicrobiaceae bacterium]|nr:cystathionine beta-lyase [Hyphomicrobiaceae bacterium]